MSRRGAVLVDGAALTCLLGLAVALPPPAGYWGRALVTFGDHGVHLSDLPSLAVWLVGMAACGILWRKA